MRLYPPRGLWGVSDRPTRSRPHHRPGLACDLQPWIAHQTRAWWYGAYRFPSRRARRRPPLPPARARARILVLPVRRRLAHCTRIVRVPEALLCWRRSRSTGGSSRPRPALEPRSRSDRKISICIRAAIDRRYADHLRPNRSISSRGCIAATAIHAVRFDSRTRSRRPVVPINPERGPRSTPSNLEGTRAGCVFEIHCDSCRAPRLLESVMRDPSASLLVRIAHDGVAGDAERSGRVSGRSRRPKVAIRVPMRSARRRASRRRRSSPRSDPSPPSTRRPWIVAAAAVTLARDGVLHVVEPP